MTAVEHGVPPADRGPATRPVTVRPALPTDGSWIRSRMAAAWGGTTIVVQGIARDVTALPLLLAEIDGLPVGLAAYDPAPQRGWELVCLDAQVEDVGVGSTLLDAVVGSATEAHAPSVWLITTNDNVRALRFYQRRGFDLVGLHRDAVTAARALKATIPLEADGIPVRHELELVRELP